MGWKTDDKTKKRMPEITSKLNVIFMPISVCGGMIDVGEETEFGRTTRKFAEEEIREHGTLSLCLMYQTSPAKVQDQSH